MLFKWQGFYRWLPATRTRRTKQVLQFPVAINDAEIIILTFLVYVAVAVTVMSAIT